MFKDSLAPMMRYWWNIGSASWLAVDSIRAHKLRTFLTLLGVMIGVASVIAVVTLVNGANTYVTTKFSRYGADVFTVSKKSRHRPHLRAV
jgi:ABC-type lipoprotein release transport system permease subunit